MPPSTTAKEATMSLGPLLNASGKIVTTRASDAKDDSESFHYVCATCHTDHNAVVRLETRRVCADHPTQHVFTTAECTDRCKAKDDGTLVHFSGEEVAAIKGGMAGKHLALNLHRADEVDHLRPTGAVLLFQPVGQGSEAVAGVLTSILEDGGVAMIGKVTLRKGGQTKIMRLRATDHGLELVEVANPEGVYAFGEVHYPQPSAAESVMVSQLVETLITPFDAEAYRSDVADRIAAAMAAKTGTAPTAGAAEAETSGPATVTDLSSILAASLAAAQSKEAA